MREGRGGKLLSGFNCLIQLVAIQDVCVMSGFHLFMCDVHTRRWLALNSPERLCNLTRPA